MLNRVLNDQYSGRCGYITYSVGGAVWSYMTMIWSPGAISLQHISLSTGWGLYSNGHEDVCVMFASIPNFWDLRTTSQKMVENVSAYSTKLIIADFDRSESPSSYLL